MKRRKSFCKFSQKILKQFTIFVLSPDLSKLPSLTYIGYGRKMSHTSPHNKLTPYSNTNVTPLHPHPSNNSRNNATGFRRRHRTIFSDEQLELMERMFDRTHYPDVMVREDIARMINLTEEKVEVCTISVHHFHF